MTTQKYKWPKATIDSDVIPEQVELLACTPDGRRILAAVRGMMREGGLLTTDEKIATHLLLFAAWSNKGNKYGVVKDAIDAELEKP